MISTSFFHSSHSSVTEEVGHKSQAPRDDPILKYSYGFSLLLSAIAFAFMEFAGAMFVYIYIKRYKKSFSKKHERKKTMNTAMEYSVNPQDLLDGGHVAMTASCAHHYGGVGGVSAGGSPASREPSPPTMTRGVGGGGASRSNATSITGVSEMFGASRPDVSHGIADASSLDVDLMDRSGLVGGTMGSGEPEDFVARPAAPSSAPFASAHRSRSVSRTQRDYVATTTTSSPSRDASPYDIGGQAHHHSPFGGSGGGGGGMPTAYHNVGFGEPRLTSPSRQQRVGDNDMNKQYKDTRNVASRDSSASRLTNVDTLRRTTAI